MDQRELAFEDIGGQADKEIPRASGRATWQQGVRRANGPSDPGGSLKWSHLPISVNPSTGISGPPLSPFAAPFMLRLLRVQSPIIARAASGEVCCIVRLSMKTARRHDLDVHWNPGNRKMPEFVTK
ncbi:MAG: hypothetical protein CFE26_01435 [Verrucomicrobiales bacterium VVV1]|nr:MAG: hypothetical protein CFE26_01435 [Verrucomicrobiales bacterium VVV1]